MKRAPIVPLVLVLVGLMVSTWTPARAQSQQGRAMWVNQTAPLLQDPNARGELFFLSWRTGVTDLFFQPGYACRTFPDGVYRCTLDDAQLLRQMLLEANTWGLRVHALTGSASWTLPSNFDRVAARIDATVAFNEAEPAPAQRFYGIHFDIEPQQLDDWKRGGPDQQLRRETLLTQLVIVHTWAVGWLRAQEPTLVYGADIHYSFAARNNDGSPQYPVEYEGVVKTAAEHLLDRLDLIGNMAFRNHSEDLPSGRRGIVSLVKDVVEYADRTPARVFVGVKTTDPALVDEPAWTSFFGQTKAEMEVVLNTVSTVFSESRGYAGMAIQNYAGYRVMPDGGLVSSARIRERSSPISAPSSCIRDTCTRKEKTS